MENKTFISRLAKRLDSDPKTTGPLVEALTSTIVEICSDMDSVAIPGFGTFRPVKQLERTETDSAGRRLLLPPSITLTFKESVVLRKKLTTSKHE